MSEPDVPTGSVTFTVKELLGRIDVKIDHLVEKLDTKADQHEFAALEEVVAQLKQDAASRSSVDAYKRWLYVFAVGLVLQTAGIILALVRTS